MLRDVDGCRQGGLDERLAPLPGMFVGARGGKDGQKLRLLHDGYMQHQSPVSDEATRVAVSTTSSEDDALKLGLRCSK